MKFLVLPPVALVPSHAAEMASALEEATALRAPLVELEEKPRRAAGLRRSNMVEDPGEQYSHVPTPNEYPAFT